jgi:hypothetical protein
VTGVKFSHSSYHAAVFLDIQVGKLLPFGLVDPKTLYWMGIPSDASESDFLTIDFNAHSSYKMNLGNRELQPDYAVTGKNVNLTFFFIF